MESLLGTKAKVKILRVLSEVRTAYNVKNLKEETELSPSIAHKAAEELAEEGMLLRIKGTRKERLYKFNTDSPFAAPIFELFRMEKTRQRKEIIFMHTWSVLEDIVSKIKDKSNLIILFGSQARGEATLNSDIDLLVMPKNSEEGILNSIRAIKVKNRINPMFLSLAAFNEEIKNNTLFYRNIKSDSIILHLNPKIKKEMTEFLKDIQYRG